MRKIMFAAPAALAAAVLAFTSIGRAEDQAPSVGTASITGVVTSADGTPASGVDVRLMQAPAGKRNAVEEPGTGEKKKAGGAVKSAKTNDAGEYEFAGLAAGTYQVVAGDKKAGLMGRQKVTLADGQSAKVDIKLEAKAAAGERKQKPKVE